MPAARSSAVAKRQPAALGRYRIVRELGRGAQGCVYLAYDEQLQREVAIKTRSPGRDPARQANLLAEARTTARLQHRHIVALHDAFEDRGQPCLVLEYVPGETLDRIVRAKGPFQPHKAVTVAIQILEGLSYAHEHGIVHRDIKPGNILIDAAGAARIMDFGIAAMAGHASAGAWAGTPRYMAPESLESGAVARSADVFSVGMTLYEMLAGRPAVEGSSVFEILHRIANEPLRPASAFNPEVSEALDQIVMRALARDPGQRYADASEMLRALQGYCSPATGDAAAAETGDAAATVEFLLNRMRHKAGFPALSGTISAINRVTAGQSQSVQALSEVLLKDFALTNRLLRMVNSSGYGHFGGSVSTISRAVLILGFDAVRDLAVTLVLFDHLHHKGQAASLREGVLHSLFSGIVARGLARQAGLRDAEEGFICAVFRNLGRLLAGFYLYEESVEVTRRMQQSELSEEAASKAVLGASYSEIGVAVARSWNLPPGIVAAMRPLADGPVARPADGSDRLQVVAALAEAVAQAARSDSPARRDLELRAIARRFGETLPLDAGKLGEIAAQSVLELLHDVSGLLGDSRKSRFCEELRRAGAPLNRATKHADALPEALACEAGRFIAAAAPEQDEAQSTAVLAAGILDITNSLADDVGLGDLLRIILETMYRGMRFTRVILFMRDARLPSFTARLGYGPDLDRLVGKLCIALGQAQDVFTVALARNVDLLISDIDTPNIRARIPDWFRKAALGHTFVLLPITVEGRPIGLLYGDRTHAGELVVQGRELDLLKTLRNQAVLALRQRR